MADDLARQMFGQLADAAGGLATALALSFVDQIVGRRALQRVLLQLRGDLLQLFQREQQQLIGIDPLLPRAANALQQQLDLMFERSNVAILPFERLRELFGDGLLLCVRFRKLTLRSREPLLQPFVFVAQFRCVHAYRMRRAPQIFSLTKKFSQKNAPATKCRQRVRSVVARSCTVPSLAPPP